jgi:hypothetical protein
MAPLAVGDPLVFRRNRDGSKTRVPTQSSAPTNKQGEQMETAQLSHGATTEKLDSIACLSSREEHLAAEAGQPSY